MISHNQTVVKPPFAPQPGNHILQYPSHCSILNVDSVIVGDNSPVLCLWYWLWNSIGERAPRRNTEMHNHPSQKGIRSDLDKKCLKWTFSNRILQQEKTSFKNGPRKSSISITFWVPHLAPGPQHPQLFYKPFPTNLTTKGHMKLDWQWSRRIPLIIPGYPAR